MQERIAILGAGALGGMYASKFFDSDPESVILVADGERKHRLEDEGFLYNDRFYQIRVVSPQEAEVPVDLLMVAVKHPQLDQALDTMAPFVGKGTQILSVMNGIDSEERIAQRWGWHRTLYGVALGMDPLREGRRIRCSREGKILFGEAENQSLTDRVRKVKALLDKAGIANEVPVDMIRTLWFKFMINVGVNQCSAVMGASFGVFQESADARALMDSVMAEVMAVGRAKGIDLNTADIDQWHQVLSGLSPTGKTSMLQDMEAGRKTEVEMFAGVLVAEGERLGVETPVNHALLRMIRVMEQRNRI